MTNHSHNDANETWANCRKAFTHRAAVFPELALIPPLIDWIVGKGWAADLFASSSLDNLVISNNSDWRKRSRSILVIPKKTTVVLRQYRQRKLAETIEVEASHLRDELIRLLPRLHEGETKT